jgi:hypothetical protein
MFARIATGWELAKQSFGILRQDKELVLFPLLSGVACVLVLASFVVPLWGTPMFDQVLNDKQAPQDPLVYVVMFAFYFVNYFVILFFNVALVSCAVKRLSGGNPTIGYGLQQAASRLPQIVAWALVSATVGMILKAIESRSEWLGKLVTSFIGAGWAIATYFVVPVLVVEQVGPWEALKRSTTIMRKTWGEALAGNVGLGFMIMLAMLPGVASFVLGGVFAAADGQGILAGIAIAAGVLWIIGVSLVSSAVQSILLTALYLYASEGKAPSQFDPALLQSAFAKRG